MPHVAAAASTRRSRIALALATAPDAAQRQTQRQRARKAGIADDVSDRIEQLAVALREARSNG
jgi:hypothetical protein